MNNDKKRINIMSSCDENYAKLVPVQLVSIADNLLNTNEEYMYEIHYYLFFSRVTDETIESLRICCDILGIIFHEIHIADIEPYIELASKGGGWSYEAYFSIESHRYLPLEVDRLIYIDAADVLILGDIGEYYFADFEDKSIIATCARYKADDSGGLVIHDIDDLSNEELRLGILRGVFNSGSYVINVDKMRRENLTINDYIELKKVLERIYPNNKQIYFGDQGLLGAALVGDIKYFGYPKIKNLWYQPYNFCIWFFDRSAEICGGNPWYIPHVIHFVGGIKPWKLTKDNEKDLKPGQWTFYKIYKLYAAQVPSLLNKK